MNEQIFVTRHSKSPYKSYENTLKSENPESPNIPDEQIENDLMEAGVELAREKAEEFFSHLDPEKDVLFFASSKEMRAFETAKIYRDVAKEKGFEIIAPYTEEQKEIKVGMVGNMASEDIRAINALSIHSSNQVVDNVFNPDAYLGEVNWEAVSGETKEKWKEAREIINSDDQGSWGANFFKHSETIQKIFPEVKSARDEYDTIFQKLLKLAQFAQEKIEESQSKKNVKVMAFGHESYMLHALNKFFSEQNMANCETLAIEVGANEIKGKFRNKEAILE
ncbi:MAG: hypothetical protein ACD_15C00111G0018 [uncultured bacterium]|nr:MAG: hypothetical protein ACD_15C00111G0018 [uncultured bacterium]